MYRACKECCIEKPLSEDFFRKASFKKGVLYLRHKCRQCELKLTLDYKKENPQKVLDLGMKWRNNNPNYRKEYKRINIEKERCTSKSYEKTERRRKSRQKYRATPGFIKNKRKYESSAKSKERRRKYYLNNRKEILYKAKLYRQSPEYKQKRKKWAKKSYLKNKNNPEFKLRSNISKRISEAFKKSGTKKTSSILKNLPYTINALMIHLESQFKPWMNWENYGRFSLKRQTWQIDHVVPQSDLPYASYNDKNFLKCWRLSNIRPLCSYKNLMDGATKERHEK